MNLNLKPAAGPVRRAFTRDMMTFDARTQVLDHSPSWPTLPNGQPRQIPVLQGSPLGYGRVGSSGGIITHDGKTVDSTGAFLVGELERLDLTMHEPLAEVSWGRDIDLREDVTIADDVSSFTLSSFSANSGTGSGQGIGTGKAWLGKATDQITGLSVDISKVPHALTPWGMELKYTIFELESAAKLGRPIDAQKYEGLQLKHQMDIDEQVYMGDTTIGATGLLNDAGIAPANLAVGASGVTNWMPNAQGLSKTALEILSDVNTALTTVWKAAAWAVVPTELRLPPDQFGYISTQPVAIGGTSPAVSILKYIQDNNLLTTTGRGRLNIQPLKWLIGMGAGGTIGTSGTVDRMFVYTKDKKRVRYPMTLLQRTPLQYDSIFHKATYFCRLGQVEWVYTETGGYFDGL